MKLSNTWCVVCSVECVYFGRTRIVSQFRKWIRLHYYYYYARIGATNDNYYCISHSLILCATKMIVHAEQTVCIRTTNTHTGLHASELRKYLNDKHSSDMTHSYTVSRCVANFGCLLLTAWCAWVMCVYADWLSAGSHARKQESTHARSSPLQRSFECKLKICACFCTRCAQETGLWALQIKLLEKVIHSIIIIAGSGGSNGSSNDSTTSQTDTNAPRKLCTIMIKH